LFDDIIRSVDNWTIKASYVGIAKYKGVTVARKNRRIYGQKINFKSLSCAPSNELGVVYLFGVLHDAFDFKIESIQAGYPDCLSRRQISSDKWEELRIEFEYKSKAFVQHKHDPDKVDMIVCWKHDWTNCPDDIEVIELSSLIPDIEQIAQDVKQPGKLTAWNEFAREKRLQGLSFPEIARLWRQRKNQTAESKPSGKTGKLSEYNKFCREKRLEGKSFSEIGELWQGMKKQEQN